MLLFYIFTVLRAQNCLPFGLRLALGPLFADVDSALPLILAFNAPSGSCIYSVFIGSKSQVCQSSVLSLVSSVVWKCDFSLSDNGNTRTLFNYTVQYSNNGILTNITKRGSYPSVNSLDQLSIWVLGGWALPPHSSNTVQCLQRQFINSNTSLTILIGNLGYDLITNYVPFLKMIEPFSSIAPLLVIPGANELGPSNANQKLVLQATFFSAKGSSESGFIRLGYSMIVSISLQQLINVPGQLALSSLKTQIKEYLSSAKGAFIKNFVFLSHYSLFSSDATLLVTPNITLLAELVSAFSLAYPSLIISGRPSYYQRLKPISPSLQPAVYTSTLTSFNTLNSFIYSDFASPIQIIEGAAGNPFMASSPTPSSLSQFISVGEGFGKLVLLDAATIQYYHFSSSSCSVVDFMKMKNGSQKANSGQVLLGGIGSVSAVVLMGLLLMLLDRPLLKRKIEPAEYSQTKIFSQPEQIMQL